MLLAKPDPQIIFQHGVQVTEMDPHFARYLKRLIDDVELVTEPMLWGTASPEMRYCAPWMIDPQNAMPEALQKFADQFAEENFGPMLDLYPAAARHVAPIQIFRSKAGYGLEWHDHIDKPCVAECLIYFSDSETAVDSGSLEVARVIREPGSNEIINRELTAEVEVANGRVAIIDNLTPCFQHRVQQQVSEDPRWMISFRIGHFKHL